MEEKQQGFDNGSGRRGSSWKVEDLLDLERCGLAADLASTNLGRAQVSSPGNWGLTAEEPGNLDFKTYDMRFVLCACKSSQWISLYNEMNGLKL